MFVIIIELPFLSQIPVTLHNLVSDKLASIIKGADPDLITGKTEKYILKKVFMLRFSCWLFL